MSMRHTKIFMRPVTISAQIRAKCGKCWGELKNATMPTTATRRAACGVSVSARMPLPMSGYVREQTTSLPTRKCLRRRDEEAFGKRLRERGRRGSSSSFFWESFSPPFFPPGRSARRFWFFPPRNRSPVTLSLALCFPRESAHYVVSCRKAKP